MAKKYSVNVENNVVVSIEVDGVSYTTPDEISDPDDRATIQRLLDQSDASDASNVFTDEFDAFDETFERNVQSFHEKYATDFQALERQAEKFPKIIVGIFLTVAVPMLAIAGVATAYNMKTLANEKSAPGRVVELIARQEWVSTSSSSSSSSSSRRLREFYYPVVEFTLPNQKVQKVELSEGSSPPEHEKGDAVTVLYDPANPRHARIDSISSTILMWILPGITGTLGIAFLVATLLVHKFLSQDAIAAARQQS